MTTRKVQRKPRRGRKRAGDEILVDRTDVNLVDWDINDATKEYLRIYAAETNLDRQVPDFRDGLKPVSRRNMFVMYAVAKTKQVKAARIVGEVMGKYHPHGDSGIFGALVTMVNQGTPPAIGVGNWGTPEDPSGAMRYIEAHLSRYGRAAFVRDYFNPDVTPYSANYDGSGKEPLVLPSLYPTLLFNGNTGIGLGVTSNVPAFTPPSVLKLMVAILKGEKLTPMQVTKKLEFFEPWGGKMIKSKANYEALNNLMTSHQTSVEFESEFREVRDNKAFVIEATCPGVNIEKLIGTIQELPSVHRASQAGEAREYHVEFRKDCSFAEYDKEVEKIKRLLRRKRKYSIAVTERTPKGAQVSSVSETNLSAGDEYDVNFYQLTLPQLIKKWLVWRIDLEKRSLTWRIAQIQARVAGLQLLVDASQNLPIIMASLKMQDSAKYLMAKLKWTEVQANEILDKRVRQLRTLDAGKLKAQIKALLAAKKVLVTKLKNPRKEVTQFLEESIGNFKLLKNKRGMNYWDLTKMPAETEEAVEEA